MPKPLTSAFIRAMTYVHQNGVSPRRTSALAKVIAALLPEGRSLLDVGSGNGKLLEQITALRPDLSVQGIDIRPAPNARVPITAYDGKTIPFEANTWDVCMASDVLHHCPEPRSVLREMCRVARESILLKDHVSDSWVDGQTLRFMDWAGNRGYGTPLPYNFMSSSAWEAAYREAGLIPRTTKRKLGLYPLPLSWVLDRNLHFVSLLDLAPPAPRGTAH